MMKLKSSFLPMRIGSKQDVHSPAFTSSAEVRPAVGFHTKRGWKHNANEDRAIIVTLSEALGKEEEDRMMSFEDMLSSKPNELPFEDVTLVGVYDGHGGSGCADYVYANLPRKIAEALAATNKTFEDLESAVIDGYKACSDDFLEQARKEDDSSGCCVLVGLFHENRALISWAGDCRAVFFDGSSAEPLTIDHCPRDPNEMKRILDCGGEVINNRIAGVLAPSRGFGDVDLRSRLPEGVLISEPSCTAKVCLDEKKLRKQFMILATDGVWNALSNHEACDIVAKALKANGYNTELAATKLVEEASKNIVDDITACVVVWNVESHDSRSTSGAGTSDEGEKQ